MAQHSLVSAVIEGFLGNPFAKRSSADKARKALAKLDLAEEVAALTRKKDIVRAKELVLAAGHQQAQHTEDPKKILDPQLLPGPVMRALPRQRAQYVRVCTAAGRAYRALSEIRGPSENLAEVRRATWAACFGHSLRHALEMEQVIRDHDILILGETGTGKELFAKAIQEGVPGGPDGKRAPRAALNAAAVPDTLVESEIFGHAKGAFTGATEARTGRLRSATGGAFFLDEVGDLPATTQVKFLRVMETNNIFPVGSDKSENVEVRYLAATHKDLEGMVEQGDFRRDLYERLAGTILRIPPLRERPEDIPEIGRAFVRRYQPKRSTEVPEHIEEWLLSKEAKSHPWPGNVRELQNALRNLLLGLPAGVQSTGKKRRPVDTSIPANISGGKANMRQVRDWYMDLVLDRTDGNLTQTARTLGIDRSTVRRRMAARE